MRTFLLQAVIVLFCISSRVPAAATSPESQSITGEWQFTTVVLGISSSERLELKSSGSEITGRLYRDGDNVPVRGSLKGHEVRIEFKIGNQENTYVGIVREDGINGNFTMKGRAQTVTGTWSARKAAKDKPPTPRTLEFIPTDFHRELSANVPAVLRIWPGDTIRTKSVDVGGQDEKSQQRVMGGNPLTGPFYVESAMPGDVLSIAIKRLRVNRDWATSDNGLVGRALTAEYASANKQAWDNTRWHLDAEKQVATLENAPDNLRSFAVQLKPMLGCVGVAPGPGEPPVSTRDSGYVGGNLDFNRISEGTTIFLQVHQPGALLFLGDAHALQGDGELNGNALETSMDIEFSVDVLREKYIGTPRAEDKDYLMAIGLAGSLDDAFRMATSELANWLQTDYKLTASEAAIVLGTSIEYNISEVADRDVGVVAKIRKSSLQTLPHTP